MLLADDLDEYAFFASAVELAVEDLFPRSKVEIPLSDGDNHLPAHDLSLEVCIAVILTGAIVAVMEDGLMGGNPAIGGTQASPGSPGGVLIRYHL
jgi:hypothetical protein